MKQEYIQFIKNNIKLEITDSNKTSNDHQILKCLICGNEFSATPKSKVTNFKKTGMPGCPICTHIARYSDIRQSNIQKLEERFEFIDKINLLTNNESKIKVKNKKCNHIFKVKYGNLLNRDVECPICNTERKSQFYKECNEERHKNSLVGKSGFDLYRRIVRKLTRETYIKNSKIINPKDLPLGRSGTSGYHVDHIVSIRYCFDNNVPEHICAHPSNLRMLFWKDNAKKWKKPTLFPQIFNQFIDINTKELTFVKDINENKKFEEFKDFGFYTTTLYSENHKIAILLASLNGYNEKSVGSNKHLYKIRQDLISKNIRPIIIFDDEYNTNSKLIKSKINHIIGENNTNVIYARKCNIKQISNEEKNAFLNINHIQRSCISQINLGAFYNNKLIAVMTFSMPRILMNKKNSNDGSVELARFATDIDYRVIGISSKLLAYFKKNYPWKEIYSYADMRWSIGNLYEKLGFELEKVNPPDYSYIINGQRKHRWGYRKDAIREKFPNVYDPHLTEYQNMIKIGYDRIWDCGTLKFIMRSD